MPVLFTAFTDSALDAAIESDLSRTFGGIGRLDMFFPFDPYLLKEFDKLVFLITLTFFLMLKFPYNIDFLS